MVADWYGVKPFGLLLILVTALLMWTSAVSAQSPAEAAKHAQEGLAPSAGTNPNQIDVDVNGPHLVLRTPAPRNWTGVTIEINNWWAYTVPATAKMSSLCVNLPAFTVKASVRGGRDYDGIYYDPASMTAKSVAVLVAGKAAPLHSVTSGMIKPLTRQETMWCLGRPPIS